MSIEMPKWKRVIFLFTLMFSNVIIMESYILSPTFNVLYETYADRVNLVNFVVSGSYLLVIAASPLASKLCAKLGEKTVLVIGGILAAVGGILMSSESIVMMCAMRCVFTVGYAFTQIAAVAVINRFYVDEGKRGYFMGYYNASMTVVGAIFSVLAGNLAVKSIYSAYGLHWIFVPYVILAIVFIPRMKGGAEQDAPEKAVGGEKAPEKAAGEKMGGTFWLTFAGLFLFNVVFGIASLFVSVYVAENGLGTEAMTGYLNVVVMIVGFVAAMGFGWLLGKLGHGIRVCCYLLLTLGMILYWLVPSAISAYALFGIMGAVYSIMNTYAFAALPTLAPESRANDVIAWVTVGATLASFVSSYLTTWYMSVLNVSYTQTLYIPVIMIATVAVAALARSLRRSTTKKEA